MDVTGPSPVPPISYENTIPCIVPGSLGQSLRDPSRAKSTAKQWRSSNRARSVNVKVSDLFAYEPLAVQNRNRVSILLSEVVRLEQAENGFFGRMIESTKDYADVNPAPAHFFRL